MREYRWSIEMGARDAVGIEHGLATTARGVKRLVAALILSLGLAAAPAFACEVVTPSTARLGTLSPAGVTTAGFIATTGSFTCANANVLALLADDYLRATLLTTGTLTLTAPTGGSVGYSLSASSDGSAPLVANTSRSYFEGTTLSLLGSSRAVVPIYIKPVSASAPPAGIYKGSFQIRWSWKFCDGIGTLGLCLLGRNDQDSKVASVDVTMTVARGAIVTVSQRTTWEASAATVNPKAIPGAKLRMTMQIENPNPFALDGDTLAFTLPTPARLQVALDGDGTASTAYVVTAEGSPASSLAVTYSGPASTADDVDFSSNNGGSWTYDPSATPRAVTNVRIRPRGTMAAGSKYIVSLPYALF
jgi:hypothetical protein